VGFVEPLVMPFDVLKNAQKDGIFPIVNKRFGRKEEKQSAP
jgi:hypothetical protein